MSKKRSKALKKGKGEAPVGGASGKTAKLLRQADALREKGKMNKAEEHYRQVLSLDPDNPRALYGQGLIAFKREEWGRAQELVRQAIHCSYEEALSSMELSDFYHTLGAVHFNENEMENAAHAFEKSIELNPNHQSALYYGGMAYIKLENIDEAQILFSKLLKLDTKNWLNHFNIASVFIHKERQNDAVEHLLRAVEINKNRPEPYCNLGLVHNTLRKFHKSIEYLEKALGINPNIVEAHLNLAIAHKNSGNVEKAIRHFNRSIELSPHDGELYYFLAGTLCFAGKIEEGLHAYRKAMETAPGLANAHSGYLLALHCTDMDSEQLYREHRSWWLQHGVGLPGTSHVDPAPHAPFSRLRIGYLSPDFKEGPIAPFAAPLMADHDEEKFEIVCYSDANHEDDVTASFRSYVDEFHRVVGMGDEELARKIREDRMDILVDLAGHGEGNRMGVFARKPAPVQVTWLGYPDTTGLETMDYRLTDAWADPEGLTEYLHSEALVRLPRGFLCYEPPMFSSEVGTLPRSVNGFITFGSFNDRSKITEKVIRTWTVLLEKVADSRLVVVNAAMGDREVRESLWEAFVRRGIDPGRLQLTPAPASVEEPLEHYNRVDIALDTFPYNGMTTTCEALWMGVPVITLAGKTHVARVGLSLLSQVGLEDLAADSMEGYVNKAVALAEDRERLQALRNGLRERMRRSSLMDAQGFAADVEVAYLKMWDTCCGVRKDEERDPDPVEPERHRADSMEQHRAKRPEQERHAGEHGEESQGEGQERDPAEHSQEYRSERPKLHPADHGEESQPERQEEAPAGEDERDAVQKILDDVAREGFSRMLVQGEEHFAQGRMEDARKCFAQVVEKSHDASLRCRALNNLGVTAYSMERMEEAEQMFIRALSLDPLDVDAISNLEAIHKATHTK